MTISGRTLLFVESNKTAAEELSRHFSEENVVVLAQTMNEAEKYLHFLSFDACILDLVLPDGSGYELLRKISGRLPTVIYTALGSEADVLKALELGAVDYITKPVSMRLLEAKLKLRLLPSKNATISCGSLVLNPVSKLAKYDDTVIPLTASEFNILAYLMKHPRKFYTGDQLYERIWNAKSLNTATVRKHISSLRPKLVEVSGKEFIVNEFGSGYAFIGDVTYQ